MYIFKQARDDHDSNLLLIFTAGGHVASIKVPTPAFFGVEPFCSTFSLSPVDQMHVKLSLVSKLEVLRDTNDDANSS